MSDDMIGWISAQILPHERDVRRWLAHRGFDRADVDDFIQEAYCRLARVGSVLAVRSPRAYFFTTVKNLIRERVRRERIVRIEAAEIELLSIADDEPSQERQISAREELATVKRLIEELPEPCRTIFRLRKIQAFSQKETAARIGLTEHQVEKHTAAGLRVILRKMMAPSPDGMATSPRRIGREHTRNRRGD